MNLDVLIEDLIGKHITSANFTIKENKLESRVVMENNKPLIVTHDFHPERLNLEIENDIVTNITLG